MPRTAPTEAIAELIRFAASGLMPDPILTIDEWADANRILTRKESPEPGPWRTARAPYLREIMECLSPSSPVRRVVFMASSQVGKSEVGNNFLGFVMDHAPGPALIVQPTQNNAKRYVRQRIRPMIEATPSLRSKVGSKRGKDATSSLQSIDFPGGVAMFAWASSASELASAPILYFFGDEIDKWERDVDEQGSAVAQAEQRTQNFRRAKILLVSTPTNEDDSPIVDEYEAGDQREWWIPCPDCGVHQVFEWKQVQWPEGKPEEAAYVCKHCGCLWDDAKRWAASTKGEWRPRKPFAGTASFFVWTAASLFVRLRDLARQFIQAKRLAKRGELGSLKTFVNLKLGETWKERSDDIKPGLLEARAESYVDGAGRRIEVPAGVGLLTMGVDVQKDRLEAEIRGWGDGEASWQIAHHRLLGDTSQSEVWQQLEAVRTREYRHASGAPLRIMITCVDSGYRKLHVYRYVAGVQAQRVFAVKGDDGARREPVTVSKKKNRQGVKLVIVGTHPMKDTLFARIAMKEIGPGYMHFRGRDLEWHNGADSEYYTQFTQERKIRVRSGRRFVEAYVPTGQPNEAIDLYVYNLAALHLLGPVTREQLGLLSERNDAWEEPKPSEEEPPQRAAAGSRRRGGWVNNW